MTTFAEQLYLALPEEDNLFFSPSSVESALGRAAIGARGNTRKQMLEVLGWTDEADEALAVQLAEMERGLTAVQDATVEVANRIYAERSYHFSPAYMALMERFAGLEKVDFLHNHEVVRMTINAWVERMTHSRIKDLLTPGTLNPITRMVLVNAVYFLGRWQYAFPAEETSEMDFNTGSGNVRASFMNQKARFGYSHTDAYQALSMPYNGGLNRLVVLPNRGTSLREVEELVANQGISTIAGSLRRQEVEVSFPKTEIGWGSFDMVDTLEALGIKDAFSEAADFTGIDNGTKDLRISGVVHKAWYADDERGTEAAAATAVVFESKSISMTPCFTADHPFVHAILGPNGQVMFMGRVTNPKE